MPTTGDSNPNGTPLPLLTVQQLTYLVEVTRAANWAEAAGRLGVTQSALSQGIAELEKRVGLTLFERKGRRQVLLPQAGEVVAYAERVVAQTRDLSRWAVQVRSGRAGRVHIGMIDAAAVHHFPDVLRAFRRDRPDVDLRLTVAPSGALLEQLTRGDLDMAVMVQPPHPVPGIEQHRLLDEPLAVYAPAGGELDDPARWGPWVTFPEGSATRRLVAEALRELGAQFEVIAESHQPEVLREMVRLGVGWTALPVVQAESPPASLRRARHQPLTSRRLVVARRSDRAADPPGDALVAALRARAT